MSDYVKTVNFTALDYSTQKILASQYDAQYDAIATAIATKADKVSSPTADHLITLDASGVPADFADVAATVTAQAASITTLDSKTGLYLPAYLAGDCADVADTVIGSSSIIPFSGTPHRWHLDLTGVTLSGAAATLFVKSAYSGVTVGNSSYTYYLDTAYGNVYASAAVQLSAATRAGATISASLDFYMYQYSSGNYLPIVTGRVVYGGESASTFLISALNVATAAYPDGIGLYVGGGGALTGGTYKLSYLRE